MRPPVPLALCAAATRVPESASRPDQLVFEPKWDGFRAALFAAGHPDQVAIQSRNGKDLSRYFPDLAAAVAAQLPAGTVLDGEIVLISGGRLSFTGLQARLTASAAGVLQLARAEPVSFAAFDVLAVPGRDLRGEPYRARRAELEHLLAAARPPLQLTPATTDRDEALRWMEDWAAFGVEGLVIKPSEQRYLGGQRGWVKHRRVTTAEAIVGGVTGILATPDTLILGLRDARGRLRVVGRTRPLRPDARAAVGAVLAEAGETHPWPAALPRSRLGQLPGSGTAVRYVRVVPLVVVELLVDAPADQRGAWRHTVRYHRLRVDLHAEDVGSLPIDAGPPSSPAGLPRPGARPGTIGRAPEFICSREDISANPPVRVPKKIQSRQQYAIDPHRFLAA